MNKTLLKNKSYTKEIETIIQAHLDHLEIEERREVGQLWETMKTKYYTPNENNRNVSSQAGKTGISAANDNPTSETTRVHCTNTHAGNRSRQLSSTAI